MDYPIRYYARDGRPLDFTSWAHLAADPDYRVVHQTEIGTYLVSTVWLGIDHNWTDTGPPLIFETMIFPSAGTIADCSRYTTEDEARQGHRTTCILIRAITVNLT
jgi:hypothetical protein